MEENIDITIRIFSEFLNSTWHIVGPLLSNRKYTTDNSSINDWIQANWELLVERKILPVNDHLEIYGEGADFTSTSSRITDPEALPSYYIQVLVHSKEDILNNTVVHHSQFIFDRLVGFTDHFYSNNPPFIYVLAYDKQSDMERVFLIEDAKFQLVHY